MIAASHHTTSSVSSSSVSASHSTTEDARNALDPSSPPHPLHSQRNQATMPQSDVHRPQLRVRMPSSPPPAPPSLSLTLTFQRPHHGTQQRPSQTALLLPQTA
ncbi:hypothetical protein MRB53_037057 [Persea americana]|nr:hypothetical protein MRB53_037057 [Persea americana]